MENIKRLSIDALNQSPFHSFTIPRRESASASSASSMSASTSPSSAALSSMASFRQQMSIAAAAAAAAITTTTATTTTTHYSNHHLSSQLNTPSPQHRFGGGGGNGAIGGGGAGFTSPRASPLPPPLHQMSVGGPTSSPSRRSVAESAMQFLERRRSNESNFAENHRLTLAVLGQIQPDLYRRRGSIISVASSFSSSSSLNNGGKTSPPSSVAAAAAANGSEPPLASSASSTPQQQRYQRRAPQCHTSIDAGGAAASAPRIIGRAQLQLSYDFTKSDFVVQLVEASLKSTQSMSVTECQVLFTLSNGGVGTDVRRCSSAGAAAAAAMAASHGAAAAALASNVKRRCGKMLQVDRDGRLESCDEQFKFAMSYDELMEQCLSMELVSARKRSGSIPICVRHARTAPVALALLNPSDDELLIWVDMEAVNEVETACGELNLGLQYLSSAARLTLTVHQATNLPARADGLLPNVFVRASLIQDEKVVLKKRKTNMRRSTLSPVWNEALTFGIEPELISRCRLEVCVMDCDRFGNNSRPIGRVNFYSASGRHNHQQAAAASASLTGIGGISATRLWREAVQGRNTVLPQWLPLEAIHQNTATSGHQ